MPGATLQVLWLSEHFWVAVAAWSLLMLGLCKLGRVHAPTALAVAVVIHGFAVGWTIFSLMLPLVPIC
jgi:hypothetical protein